MRRTHRPTVTREHPHDGYVTAIYFDRRRDSKLKRGSRACESPYVRPGTYSRNRACRRPKVMTFGLRRKPFFRKGPVEADHALVVSASPAPLAANGGIPCRTEPNLRRFLPSCGLSCRSTPRP